MIKEIFELKANTSAVRKETTKVDKLDKKVLDSYDEEK